MSDCILQVGAYDTPYDAMLQEPLDKLWGRLFTVHEFDKVLAAIAFATATNSLDQMRSAISHIITGHLGMTHWDQARPFLAGLSVGLHDHHEHISHAIEARGDSDDGYIPLDMARAIGEDTHLMTHLVMDQMSYCYSLSSTLLLAWELDHPGSLMAFTQRMADRFNDDHPEFN